MDQALTAERLPLQIVGSAGDVKDRADLPWLEARDQSAGLFCWDSDKVNMSARSLLHHLSHDRQRAVGPVPMIKRGPPQGISSAAESGVCPNVSR